MLLWNLFKLVHLQFRGIIREGAKGAKAAFEILAKCSVFSLLLSYSIEKRGSETPFKQLIP